MQLKRHTLPDGLQSVNGSDNNGGCSRVIGGPICGELDVGGRSDLTDCVIPSLGGFQSNWAAELFTVNRSGQSFHIGFDFSRPVNFTRVELDLFNCPEWGIAVQTITVYEYTFGTLAFVPAVARALGNTTANTSCTSIVRVVIPLELPQNPAPFYILDFTFDNATTHIQWVHIAEVRFFEEDTQCPTPSSTTGMIIANSDRFYVLLQEKITWILIAVLLITRLKNIKKLTVIIMLSSLPFFPTFADLLSLHPVTFIMYFALVYVPF